MFRYEAMTELSSEDSRSRDPAAGESRDARRESHSISSPQANGGAARAVIAFKRIRFMPGQSRWYRECAFSSLSEKGAFYFQTGIDF